MTTICAMQPYLFPYLPYFQLAHAVDTFWVLDDVQYIRRGWMHRNRLAQGGQVLDFALPVARGRQADLVADKRLAPEAAPALARLGGMLRHACAGAPHRDEALALVAGLAPEGRFLDLALAALRGCFGALGLAVPLRLASSLSLPGTLRGQDRILALCAAAGATRYVNPAGGRALYHPAAFAAAGVELRFLDGRLDPYPRGGSPFVPGLSVLDAIAWLDRDARARQVANYETVPA